jgi:ribonuclease E
MKRILINATQSEELRVAIVDTENQSLLDLLVEHQGHKTKTGNIYLGKITAIEPSLDAAFVNFGSERHGFLPFKEIHPSYFTNYDPNKSDRQPNVKDAIREGQTVMVQVEKEERGNKGSALTTFISLAGSYLVLMPNNPRAGGISRRVEGEDRDELREILAQLPLPEDAGLIVRTAGVGKASSELQWDLSTLLKHWESIQKAAAERSPPFLIHQESDVVIRTIRDHLRQDVSEILVDDAAIFERMHHYLEQIRPDFVSRLKQYTSNIPLFSRYQIEHQIESAHAREVRLPSGASIVFGYTEALVAIDINSGQATKGKDIEQTAFEINKEAARFIASQLRLRDIGGLIVIDFIDMPSSRHRREVENELRNALRLDKARTQVGSISQRFGLLEMSRQRLRQSLGEATRLTCPRCDGWGSIRSIESLSLSILRMIEEDTIRPGTTQVQAHLPVDVATFIINEKRDVLANIEKIHNVHIVIVPSAKLEAPHYRLRRLTAAETGTGKPTSYRLVEQQETDTVYKRSMPARAEETPAVKALFTDEAAAANRKQASGLVKRLFSSLFGANEAPEKTSAPATKQSNTQTTPDRQSRQRDRSRSGGRNQQARSTDGEDGARTHGNRSRRGARGGRRRSTSPTGVVSPTESTNSEKPTTDKMGLPKNRRQIQPRHRSAPVIEAPKNLTAPEHLPPFPSDLEDYYQKSSGFTPRAKDANKTETPAVTTERPTPAPLAVQPQSPVAVAPQPVPTPAVAPSQPAPTPVTAQPAPAVIASDNWTPRKIVSSTGEVVAPVTSPATSIAAADKEPKDD